MSNGPWVKKICEFKQSFALQSTDPQRGAFFIGPIGKKVRFKPGINRGDCILSEVRRWQVLQVLGIRQLELALIGSIRRLRR